MKNLLFGIGLILISININLLCAITKNFVLFYIGLVVLLIGVFYLLKDV